MNQAPLIGHDSEGALSKQGKIFSALDALRGVHEDENGRYFADNMNFEIAINPVTTLKEFHSKTEALLDQVRGEGYDLVFTPTVLYPESALKHPGAMVSGCSPDYSAYTASANTPPDFATFDKPWRSCGAHVHATLGSIDPYNFCRWMDIHLALPLLSREQPSKRRELYGKAGCMRVKPYPGAEYRTLSNMWVANPELREFVWDGTHKAIEDARTKDASAIEDWWDVPTAIDTHDLELARRTLDRLYIYGVLGL